MTDSDGKSFLPARAIDVLSRCYTQLLLSVMLMAATLPLIAAPTGEWRTWDSFRQRYIQPDGRVIEHEFDARTTSEAQAYAMFFALVDNQPQLFALLLGWTESNLAGGDLSARLPGWLWGQAKTRSGSESRSEWRLLDENSASDADLWLAYTLLEAGRLWQVPRYQAKGLSLLRQVSRKEMLRLPGGFITLLPAQRGFQVGEQHWRVNPSYLVPQQLSFFSRVDPAGPWQRLEAQLPQLLSGCCASGFAPDWLTYHRREGWQADNGGQLIGSYDAIRVYLWAGMMHAEHPGRQRLLDALHGMHKQLQAHGEPPERIDLISGQPSGKAPPGFIAAVTPFLDALDEKALLAGSVQKLQGLEVDGLYGRKHRYYDQVLALFGLGYLDRRYRFSRCGELLPAWSNAASDC